MSTIVRFDTLVEMFDRVAACEPVKHHPALMYKSGKKYTGITRGELRRDAQHFALGLSALGVHRGDRVAIIAENRPEWIVADLGMMMIGAVNVGLFTTLPRNQVEVIFNDAGVTAAVVSGAIQMKKIVPCLGTVPTLRTIIAVTPSETDGDKRIIAFTEILEMGTRFGNEHPGYLEREKEAVRPDDLLALIYTSGTTGAPRGVMLTHRNLVSNMTAAADCIPFGPADTILSFLPLCHSYQRMGGYYTAMACGVTIAFAESIDTLMENFMEIRPTVVTTVPRFLERFHARVMKQMQGQPAWRRRIFDAALKAGELHAGRIRRTSLFDRITWWLADHLVLSKIRARMGGRIRFFVSGGAALRPEIGHFFDAAGIRVIEGYGLSEASPVISVNRVDDFRFGTVGKLLPGVEAHIAPDGEILVRGENVMRGYWNDPKLTAEVIDSGGWLHTGDIGAFDRDGFLSITDRKKHLIVTSGGKNIAPQPIEQLFQQNPFIDQFVCIGDGRTYLSALIVPNFDLLRSFAAERKLSYDNFEQLVKSREVQEMMGEIINGIQKDLANFERVRKFTILPRPLTVEDGELTPLLKVRRKIVEEEYRNLIDAMYSGVV
jgi:long-chain acyl-CoA synthetase